MDKARIKKFSQFARSKLIPQMWEMIDFWMWAEEVSWWLRVGTKFFNDSNIDKYTDARKSLMYEINKHGKESVAEQAAYIRFNRIIALRYMEIHRYLPIKSSLFTSDDWWQNPDIIKNAIYEYAQCGLDEKLVFDLESKHDYAELYRFMFIGLCNQLSHDYWFIFSKIDNRSILLFPKDILSTSHIINNTTSWLLQIPDGDWQEVEIIWWMYQYYISERKEELDKSTDKLASWDDIAASTQLFTPEWIVKYLVHNTVGKLSESKLTHKIKTSHTFSYTIDDIESFKILDPAMGSWHILVRAYDVLKDIYKAKGYSVSQIPQLILTNNLYGFDICPRAEQLACFAVLMKAKADDDSIHTKVNIAKHLLCIEENNNFLEVDSEKYPNLRSFLQLRYNASLYGSLIRIPKNTDEAKIRKEFIQFQASWPLLAGGICDNQTLELLLHQTNLLSYYYDCVVANPPYKAGGKVDASYSKFLSTYYPDGKADLFAVFITRCLELCTHGWFIGMVTMHSWMFLSSYEEMRKELLQKYSIDSLVHHGAHGFPEISGEVVQTVSFIIHNNRDTHVLWIYIDLTHEKSAELKEEMLIKTIQSPSLVNCIFERDQQTFGKIPGSPIAYSSSIKIWDIFQDNEKLWEYADPRGWLSTNDNEKFLRLWHEVISDKTSIFDHKKSKKWFPMNKWGGNKKWYWLRDYLINYENDGSDLKELATKLYRSYSRTLKNIPFYFIPHIWWSAVTSNNMSARLYEVGFIFWAWGSWAFPEENQIYLLWYFNSKVFSYLLFILNPTINLNSWDIRNLPIIFSKNDIEKIVENCVSLSKLDRDLHHTSRDFQQSPLLIYKQNTLEKSYQKFCDVWTENFFTLHGNEEELNRQFIEIYGLQNELTAELPLHEITILQDELDTKQLKDHWNEILKSRQLPRKREVIAKQLMSYILGCIMGRYSLDTPWLTYAWWERDASKYKTFLPDGDAVIPVLDDTYFEDDIVERTKEFIRTVWGKDNFTENLQRLAESLEPKSNKSNEVIIRDYRQKKFMDDHYSNYSKRPIYWYFASNPKKWKAAFQAIVYLHRINNKTISRLRHEYLHKFQAKLEAEQERLQDHSDRDSEKRKTQLRSILSELAEYDKKLKNFADKEIIIDLDDGVKKNYWLFMKEWIVVEYKI